MTDHKTTHKWNQWLNLAKAPKHPRENFLGKQLQIGQHYKPQMAHENKRTWKASQKTAKTTKIRAKLNFSSIKQKNKGNQTLRDPLLPRKMIPLSKISKKEPKKQKTYLLASSWALWSSGAGQGKKEEASTRRAAKKNKEKKKSKGWGCEGGIITEERMRDTGEAQMQRSRPVYTRETKKIDNKNRRNVALITPKKRP